MKIAYGRSSPAGAEKLPLAKKKGKKPTLGLSYG
jgi:hypothetical protein